MTVSNELPVPDGFTISWEHPDDSRFLWSLDSMHNPHPISEVEDTLSRLVYGRGMTSSFKLYDVPMQADARRFWTYHYSAINPLFLSEEEAQAMGRNSEEKLRQAVATLGERWDTEWLPEIKSHIEHLDAFPLQDASMQALVAHLDDTLDRHGRLWEIHFQIVLPMMLAIHFFDEMYTDLFNPESALEPYKLLQGFENMTVAANHALWKLSRRALAVPEVRGVFAEHAAGDVIAVLESSPAGQEFLSELRDYLAVYGHRADTWGARQPTWIENPRTVILNLQDYLAQPDRDPELEFVALIADRDQAIAEAHERLQGYPEEVRRQFEFLLNAAQTGVVLSEDHGFWIDFRGAACVRGVFMELGRRFAKAGVVDDPNDVFHLTVEEIRATATELPDIDRRELVQSRKAEIEHYASVQPPPAIGTPPPGPPPDNPLTRTLGKFFGKPPEPTDDPGVLKGSGGSSGVARGVARVVKSLADAGKIGPGDILVAPTTAPPWTPLFATVAAVVTDTGGILSHCAVVAREYGIPAVVGTGMATATIRDGQFIEVNGDLGTVRIINDAPTAPDVAVQPEPQPIPVPENFPVEWPNPEDERGFWLVERMHWPDPLTPMDFDFMRAAHEQFGWAFAQYGVPLQYNVRLLNYYWYFSVGPSVSDPSEIPELMKAGVQNIADTIPRLYQLWNEEWLPEVQQHLDYWRGFDLTRATLTELRDHFEETVARHSRVWQIHFLQTFPVYTAMSTFEDLYQDLFGNENALDAYRLMQGFENKTVEIGRALWRLSRTALESPALRPYLEESDASDVIPALEQSNEGRAFLSDLRAFLGEYGRRGEKLGVSYPTWIEDPTQAVRQLQEYFRQQDLDFNAETARLATERERTLAEARAALDGYPQPVVDQFESTLRFAQQATVISEDHTVYIDFGTMYEVRQVLLEFGRRFAAAGVLDDPNDIFLLTCAELRETAETLPDIRRQTVVAERKAEIDHFRSITPPPALGTPATAPHPDDPLARAVGRFFGAPPPAPEGPPDALLIRGGTGSSGKAQGVARVIGSLSEAGRLQRGEILVAPTTAPAWTPLFASAAAVVTDTGGILSHCAVVAREYGIPAVVGTGVATSMIRDGQIIEVNGDLGTVRIIG